MEIHAIPSTRFNALADESVSQMVLHWIDGQAVHSSDGTSQTRIDPATGGNGTAVALGDSPDVDDARAFAPAITAGNVLAD